MSHYLHIIDQLCDDIIGLVGIQVQISNPRTKMSQLIKCDDDANVSFIVYISCINAPTAMHLKTYLVLAGESRK